MMGKLIGDDMSELLRATIALQEHTIEMLEEKIEQLEAELEEWMSAADPGVDR